MVNIQVNIQDNIQALQVHRTRNPFPWLYKDKS